MAVVVLLGTPRVSCCMRLVVACALRNCSHVFSVQLNATEWKRSSTDATSQHPSRQSVTNSPFTKMLVNGNCEAEGDRSTDCCARI